LVDLLHAYGATRVVSSPSTRCTQTLAPYAEEQVLPLVELPGLSEEEHDPETVRHLVEDALATPEPTVVCTHRPVLPGLLELLGVDEEPLSPSELVVCHHREGRVLSVERHRPAPPVT
ncbi:MAG: mismatch repair protein MutT, partial [Marmoricola sp.]|nr:mismatch repair protein MutT [Marmoricola sp.]